MLGASTISQQTAKNLFLSLSRNPLRKWHEVLLTIGLESNIKKDRILDLYLNIAEMGDGVFGIEAASRKYFYKSAYALNRNEIIALAASLPSPRKHNPKTNTKVYQGRVAKIRRNWNLTYPRRSKPVPIARPVINYPDKSFISNDQQNGGTESGEQNEEQKSDSTVDEGSTNVYEEVDEVELEYGIETRNAPKPSEEDEVE